MILAKQIRWMIAALAAMAVPFWFLSLATCSPVGAEVGAAIAVLWLLGLFLGCGVLLAAIGLRPRKQSRRVLLASPRKKGCLAVYAVLLVILACLMWLETRREYCRFCGAGRWVLSVRFPFGDIYEERRWNRISDALGPLVHGDGTPHRWLLVNARRSLLGRMWEDFRWPLGHYGIDRRRHRMEDWVGAMAYWDPELAVAAS